MPVIKVNIELAECLHCHARTNHDIVQQLLIQRQIDVFNVEDSDWDEGVAGVNYQIIRCRGCETVSFRQAEWSSEETDPFTGDPVEYPTLYPNRTTGQQPIPEHERLPTLVRRVYLEVLAALNNSMPILAAIGLRTLIEAICKHETVEEEKKALVKNIDSLETKGLLSKNNVQLLHALRFMGNSATHEMVTATPTELKAALKIAETLLETIYILPEMVKKITTGQKQTTLTCPRFFSPVGKLDSGVL